MNLEEKLRQLKNAAEKSKRDTDLERQLEHLRRVDSRPRQEAAARGGMPLPAHRAPKGIEAYVEGRVEQNEWGEFFLARQALPFGRPYCKLRIGDLSGAELSPLNLFLGNSSLPAVSRLMFLDTETTGLAGGTGTCAFLIGIGAVEGSQFAVRQFFLRDYPEEKATLAALTKALENDDGLVTFNGKTFDIPLLETRYALARLKSPFGRLLHLDLLHPARRMWKLRLEKLRAEEPGKRAARHPAAKATWTARKFPESISITCEPETPAASNQFFITMPSTLSRWPRSQWKWPV